MIIFTNHLAILGAPIFARSSRDLARHFFLSLRPIMTLLSSIFFYLKNVKMLARQDKETFIESKKPKKVHSRGNRQRKSEKSSRSFFRNRQVEFLLNPSQISFYERNCQRFQLESKIILEKNLSMNYYPRKNLSKLPSRESLSCQFGGEMFNFMFNLFVFEEFLLPHDDHVHDDRDEDPQLVGPSKELAMFVMNPVMCYADDVV